MIPTINEEKTIGLVIDSLNKINNIEIIVVDTNSTDDTCRIAEEKGAKVIAQPKRGYGLAYKTGLKEVSGDVIVCLDGDGTYPPEVVEPLVKIMEINEVDFISCDRMSLRTSLNYTTLHYVGNSILNATINIFFKVRMNDSQSGMWVFKKTLYESMGPLSDGMSFSQDIKIEAVRGGKFMEVPVKYGVRITKPKLKTWRDGFNNLFYLFIKRVER